MPFVSCLDDSISENSVTIGGPVFSRIQLNAFSKRWSKLLHRYRIPEPLHMVDFVRPHGKHIGVHREMKESLFRDASALINGHKLYSLSISIPQQEFRSFLPEEISKAIAGPYAFAFFTAVLFNQGMAEKKQFGERIAYLVDRGSAHPEQLIAAHATIQRVEQQSHRRRRTADLDFDTDDRAQALQAADLVVWSARRKESGNLGDEFTPLNQVLSEDKPPHCHVPIPLEGIMMLAEPIYHWIARHGSLPALSDIVKS
jgi:hypothetical protein